MELLSPAGTMEAVYAAVQNGADAVYLGAQSFNARQGAKNFSEEELSAAIDYCHLRGCQVHVTLNTLLTDRELTQASRLAAQLRDLGADALIVQDLGAARMLRQVAPGLALHASTQMTIHSLEGVYAAAEMGFSRVVLSRELSREALEIICEGAPIEVEVFAHGALCMCYSGQCFLSSVLGGRSGNRGACAQPCRLPYGFRGKADEYPLSLKDLALVEHLGELEKMGVTSLKIEGRMKRAEYVAVVTRIYAAVLREHRAPTAEELRDLQQAFSRQGFTDGYYRGEKGRAMFGVHEQAPEPKELYARAKETYANGENRKEPVRMYARILKGKPAEIAVQDARERVVIVQGPVPEASLSVPLTRETVAAQLTRTGGTPYQCEKVIAQVEPELSLPLSALNALRREALDKLSAQRRARPAREGGEYRPGVRYENRKAAPLLTVSLRKAGQLTRELLKLRPALVYLPLDELGPEAVKLARQAEVPLCVSLPRVCWDREMETLDRDLARARSMGVEQVLCGDFGTARRARARDFRVRADFGIGVMNSQSLKELKRMDFLSATASFELNLAQVRDLSKPMDLELLAYGRLPLMITENCIIHNATGQHTCANVNLLTDRKGERFPVLRASGCRNELFNSKKLFLADKLREVQHLGLWALRLNFTTENAAECAQVLERYQGKGRYTPNEYTRLYWRR